MNLKEYKEKHKLTWEHLANQIGISYQGLMDILKNRSPKTSVITALKIKEATGLEPYEYLDGLETIKKLNHKL